MGRDLREGNSFDRDPQKQRQLLDALWGILEALKVVTRKRHYGYPQSLAWHHRLATATFFCKDGKAVCLGWLMAPYAVTAPQDTLEAVSQRTQGGVSAADLITVASSEGSDHIF